MSLPEGFPQKTLGWGVLDWCSEFLVNPDARGGIKGEQWVFKPDQAKFILWWYAVDENGDWIYRRAYRERAKGTGKSPMVAAIACAEFLGPTVFDHFDEVGNAVGRPNLDAQIQLAAISYDQCRHTYRFIMEMLRGKAESHYNLDIGMTRILVKGQGQSRMIEIVTSNYRSREGALPTYVIAEETQNWIPSERGPELFEVLSRGLTKTDGRIIEVTNAPIPGEGSVAEMTHKYHAEIQKGIALDEGLLFDTFSIHVDDIYDREQAMPALETMYENAPWMRLDRVFADICDPSMREVNARRFFFNEIVEPTAMWIPADVWDNAAAETKLRRTDLISLGFKAWRHSGAVVATRLKDSTVFLLKLWERPQDAPRDWEVPYAEIDLSMRKIFAEYNVYNVVASPESFQDIIGRWAIDYEGDIQVEALWTSRNRQKTADAIEMFETAVKNQRLRHSADIDLTRHVMNCFTQFVAQGTLLRPETTGSSRYIVAAEAAVLSYKAAQEAIEDGALKEPTSDILYSF